MSKYDGHTPGPWRCESGVVAAPIPGGDHLTRAVAYVGDEYRHQGGLQYGDERDANGRLIADAPMLLQQRGELLEALEDAIEAISDYVDSADGADGDYGVPGPNWASRLTTTWEGIVERVRATQCA